MIPGSRGNANVSRIGIAPLPRVADGVMDVHTVPGGGSGSRGEKSVFVETSRGFSTSPNVVSRNSRSGCIRTDLHSIGAL